MGCFCSPALCICLYVYISVPTYLSVPPSLCLTFLIFLGFDPLFASGSTPLRLRLYIYRQLGHCPYACASAATSGFLSISLPLNLSVFVPDLVPSSLPVSVSANEMEFDGMHGLHKGLLGCSNIVFNYRIDDCVQRKVRRNNRYKMILSINRATTDLTKIIKNFEEGKLSTKHLIIKTSPKVANWRNYSQSYFFAPSILNFWMRQWSPALVDLDLFDLSNLYLSL